MCFERVSLVAVFSIAFSALSFAVIVGADKLGHTRKIFGACWYVIAQVDQQVSRLNVVVVATDRYGRLPVLCTCRHQVMRHEAAVAKRPEELVDTLRICRRTGVYVHCVFEAIRFFCESAREELALLRACIAENVEIDPGH